MNLFTLSKTIIFLCCLVLICVSQIFGRSAEHVAICITSLICSTAIALRASYMTIHTGHDSLDYTCYFTRSNKTFNVTRNEAEYWGLAKSVYESRPRMDEFINGFYYLIAVTLYSAAVIHQTNLRRYKNLPAKRPPVMFPEVDYANSNDSLGNMVKYLANYGFYKFGLELCFIFFTATMSFRMDVFALFYAVILVMIFALPRPVLSRIWFVLVMLIVVAVPYQYFNALGFPPSMCKIPEFWNSKGFNIRIQKLLFLQNDAYPPKVRKVFFDFVLLMLVSRQWKVFRIERKYGDAYPGGSNRSVTHLLEDRNFVNPVPDFVTYSRNSLDVIKRAIMCSHLYISLLALFVAGAQRVGVFTFFYLTLSCMYLWEGSDLYLRPLKNIYRRWNFLICYTLIVMVARIVTQYFGCVLFYYYIENCLYVDIFSIGCVDWFDDLSDVPDLHPKTPCPLVERHLLGIGFDSICFSLLIIQRRLFRSLHFFHLVNDAKLYTILAFKGAEMMRDMRIQSRKVIDDENRLIRTNVAKKLAKIQANQKKIQVIRSGDYYLFDDVEKDEINLLPSPANDDVQPRPYDPMTISEYLSSLILEGMYSVLQEREVRDQLRKSFGQQIPAKAGPSKEPKPGTSKAADSPPPDKTRLDKFVDFIILVWGFFESAIVSTTLMLDRMSRNLKRIMDEMQRLKLVVLREKPDYFVGIRLGAEKVWQPSESYEGVLKTNSSDKGKSVDYSLSIYAKFLVSCWYFLMSQSEWCCYLMIILYQIIGNNFLSVPLPLMVFFWGALAIPRPTRTFWVIIMSYVMILLITKSMYQIEIVPWDNVTIYDPFNAPYFLGLYKESNNLFNLFFLLSIFFHRIVLKFLGLWKTTEYRTTTLLDDGDYIIQDGKFKPVESQPKNVAAAQKGQILTIKSGEIQLGEYFPASISHSVVKYAQILREFMQQLVQPAVQVPVDVYTPMFLCDLVNLVILIFFFEWFSKPEDVEEENYYGFINYISDNEVPLRFILVVIFFVSLMILDRWIYLKKYRFGKLIFHYIQVVFYHCWLLILIPLTTDRIFKYSPPTQTFYFFKCIYFLLSAYQIRSGYPVRTSGHCLWKNSGTFNRFLFKTYMFVPYVFEIRTLIDWTCADTCLSVTDWFKLEDITSNIFDQKCQQDFEMLSSQEGGEKKKPSVKYVMGFCLLGLLIIVLVAPLLLFAMGKSVGQAAPVLFVELVLVIGSSEKAFKVTAQDIDITSFDQQQLQSMQHTFNGIRRAVDVFSVFEPKDIQAVRLSTQSAIVWAISDADFDKLVGQANGTNDLPFSLQINVAHKTPSEGAKVLKDISNVIKIPPLPDSERMRLVKMLQDPANAEPIKLTCLLPKFIKILNDDTVETITEVMEDTGDEFDNRMAHTYRNVLVRLKKQQDSRMTWEMKEECDVQEDNYRFYLSKLVHNSCDDIVIYFFCEKMFSKALGLVTSGGIIGMYLLYFMLVFGVVRDMYVKMSEIWMEDMPYVDRIYKKCLEIYIARDMECYELEEELFAQLIFIMRSREICIKMTREPDDPYNPIFLTPTSSKGSGSK